jgi:chromosome segregation ATPase
MRSRAGISALGLLATLALSGCGYVHLGRVPEPVTTVVGDEKLLKENNDLRLEKKMLQQELALTRSQGDALRTAIENRTADGDTSKRLADKLTDTSRELALLRSSYAKLQTERASAPAANPAEIATLQSKLGATEDKLAGSLRNYTELQGEIGRLRTEVDQTRAENVTLTEKVKVVTAQSEQAQAALAQLNTDLLAQKEQRTRVEQDAATLRTQLESANTRISALAQQRTAAAGEARSIAAPDADSAGLRDQLEVLRKKVWTLETERTALQQQLAAAETAAKNPGLAETKARAESEGKLTAALESAKMLRDENSQLKASATELAKTKADLEAELAKAKAAVPLAAQAQTLADLLRQTEARAATLSDENSMLKARLALSGGPAAMPSAAGTSAPAPATPITTANGAGVTATFVTTTPGQITITPATNGAVRRTGVALRFHTVAVGDTLSKISTTYYGTPTRWSEILVANRDILGEDNNLVIGRTLRIP